MFCLFSIKLYAHFEHLRCTVYAYMHGKLDCLLRLFSSAGHFTSPTSLIRYLYCSIKIAIKYHPKNVKRVNWILWFLSILTGTADRLNIVYRYYTIGRGDFFRVNKLTEYEFSILRRSVIQHFIRSSVRPMQC